MTLTEEYLAATFPEPCRILGVNLRPFSLGHKLLMQWMHNAFVIGGNPDVEDLTTGIWTCSLTYAEALKSILEDKIELVERGRWRCSRKVMPLAEAFSRWQKTAGEFDLKKKCDEFSIYIQSGCKIPMVTATRGDSGDSGSPIPEVQSVKISLMSKMSLTEAEIMDRPWALCVWDCYTLAAQSGAAKFLDEDDVKSAVETADAVQAAIDSGKLKL